MCIKHLGNDEMICSKWKTFCSKWKSLHRFFGGGERRRRLNRIKDVSVHCICFLFICPFSDPAVKMFAHMANSPIMSFVEADDPDDRAKVTAESNNWKCVCVSSEILNPLVVHVSMKWFIYLNYENGIVGSIKMYNLKLYWVHSSSQGQKTRLHAAPCRA